MGLQALVIAPLLRPRVVHRLPGRLRIYLPAVQRLPPDNQPLLDLIEAVLTVPLEIRSAQVSPATGNVLLTYDSPAVGEEEVMEYVHGIARMLAKHWLPMARLSLEKLIHAKHRWIAAVKSAIHYRLQLDENLEIPTDDLAEA